MVIKKEADFTKRQRTVLQRREKSIGDRMDSRTEPTVTAALANDWKKFSRLRRLQRQDAGKMARVRESLNGS